MFQAKNREDIEKKVILGSSGRETEEHTSEIGKNTHKEEDVEEKNNERAVFQQRKEKGTTSNYQEEEDSTDEDVDTYIKKGQETIMGMEWEMDQTDDLETEDWDMEQQESTGDINTIIKQSKNTKKEKKQNKTNRRKVKTRKR